MWGHVVVLSSGVGCNSLLASSFLPHPFCRKPVHPATWKAVWSLFLVSLCADVSPWAVVLERIHVPMVWLATPTAVVLERIHVPMVWLATPTALCFVQVSFPEIFDGLYSMLRGAADCSWCAWSCSLERKLGRSLRRTAVHCLKLWSSQLHGKQRPLLHWLPRHLPDCLNLVVIWLQSWIIYFLFNLYLN